MEKHQEETEHPRGGKEGDTVGRGVGQRSRGRAGSGRAGAARADPQLREMGV